MLGYLVQSIVRIFQAFVFLTIWIIITSYMKSAYLSSPKIMVFHCLWQLHAKIPRTVNCQGILGCCLLETLDYIILVFENCLYFKQQCLGQLDDRIPRTADCQGILGSYLLDACIQGNCMLGSYLALLILSCLDINLHILSCTFIVLSNFEILKCTSIKLLSSVDVNFILKFLDHYTRRITIYNQV